VINFLGTLLRHLSRRRNPYCAAKTSYLENLEKGHDGMSPKLGSEKLHSRGVLTPCWLKK
jgi:hypothetical protein